LDVVRAGRTLRPLPDWADMPDEADNGATARQCGRFGVSAESENDGLGISIGHLPAPPHHDDRTASPLLYPIPASSMFGSLVARTRYGLFS